MDEHRNLRTIFLRLSFTVADQFVRSLVVYRNRIMFADDKEEYIVEIIENKVCS